MSERATTAERAYAAGPGERAREAAQHPFEPEPGPEPSPAALGAVVPLPPMLVVIIVLE